ncbi:hypothetical protein [Nitrosopumilus sp.]|uniref:hypothetical protein n=1 Tax=Nitrosopumilus sp. TaxID=2024843 RepID=UPI003B5B6DCE
MILKATLAIFALSIIASFAPAHAQHHSGSLAPPVDFDGMAVALSSILSPEDYTIDESDSVNLSIRFFDSLTNTNIDSVTYRVQIFHGENLLANEYFFDEDGELNLDIRPTSGCTEKDLWKCTKYFGEKHPIAGGYYARGDSRPTVQGPIFDQSGQYTLKVSIVGATNPKTMTTSDLYFETFLSIPEKQLFTIQTVNAQEFPVLIKSFDNTVIDFNFDEKSNKISYKAPVNLEHHDHHTSSSSSAKQSIYLEKDFEAFKLGQDINILVEGIEVQDDSFVFDITKPEKNIIRLDIPHEELLEILDKSSTVQQSEKNTIKVEIVPGDVAVLGSTSLNFENRYTANVTWESEMTWGEKTPFTISFFDENNNPADNIMYAYSISDSSGDEIWSNIGTSDSFLGILVPYGIHQESVQMPSDGAYQLKIIITGQDGTNFDQFLVSQAEIKLTEATITTKTTTSPSPETATSPSPETATTATPSIIEKKQNETPSIPSWVKNSAGWWAEDIVGDGEFINSIQFLIKEKIITVAQTQGSQEKNPQGIPAWIKGNAGWWADGLISDEDFMQGIQHLIETNVIVIPK